MNIYQHNLFRWIGAVFDWADENAHKVVLQRATTVFGDQVWQAKIAYFDGQSTRYIACSFPWSSSPEARSSQAPLFDPLTPDVEFNSWVYESMETALEELKRRPKPTATQAQMDKWAEDIIKSNKKTRI